MDNRAQWALVGAAWFLALSVAVLGYLGYRHFAAPAQGPPTDVGLAQPLAPGSKATCPVTRAELTVGADTPSAVYKGQTYYFAPATVGGKDNKTLFLMDPERYLSGVSGLGGPAALSPAAH